MSSGNNSVSLLRIGLRHVDLKEYCRLNQQVACGPVLVRLTLPDQGRLLELGQVAACSDGEAVTSPEHPRVALVLGGTVGLSTSGCEFAAVGPGDFVGLEHLFPGSSEFASLARGEVRLAVFAPEDLQPFLDGVPELREYLRQVAEQRCRLAQENSDFFSRW